MELAEEFLKYLIGYALENCREDLEFMCKMWDKELIERLEFVLHNDFKRLDYTEGIEILKASGPQVRVPVRLGMRPAIGARALPGGGALQASGDPRQLPQGDQGLLHEAERRRADGTRNGRIIPKIGEIIGGSEREADYGKLCARIKELNMNERELWWYLDTRRWGSAPPTPVSTRLRASALFVTGMGNIRDVIPFPAPRSTPNFLGAAARRPKIGHTGCAEGAAAPSSCALILILSTHGYSSETGDDASSRSSPPASIK